MGVASDGSGLALSRAETTWPSGISWEGTVLDAGIERKVVQKSGSHFSFEDERLGQGRQNATAFLREHPDVTQQVLLRLQALAGPDQVVSARLLPEVGVPEPNGKPAPEEAEEAEPAAEAQPEPKVASKT